MSAIGVGPSKVDTAAKTELDKGSAGGPVASLIGDIVLHAGVRVDFELDSTNGWAQPLVILACIFIVGIVLGVTARKKTISTTSQEWRIELDLLDMFLWTVNTQSIRSHLEFTRGIAEAQERKDPHQNTDRIGLQIFKSSNVHCLRATEAVRIQIDISIL